MAKTPPTLISQRFRLLLQQLIDEEKGNVSAAGRRLGLSQPHAKQIVDCTRNAKMETIEKAQRRLPVAIRFFVEPQLGQSPNYREFLEKSPRTGGRPGPYAAVPVALRKASDAPAIELQADAGDASFGEVVKTLDGADATDVERDFVISQLRKGAQSRSVTVGYVLGVLDTVRVMVADGALRPAVLRSVQRAQPQPRKRTTRGTPSKASKASKKKP